VKRKQEECINTCWLTWNVTSKEREDSLEK